MKSFLIGLLPLYCLLVRCVSVFAANGSNGNNNGGTQYELKIDTRKSTDDCNYLRCDLDGLESHLLVTKTKHIVSKVLDGSTEIWARQNNLECLGGLFSYKDSDKKLALLVLLNSSNTSAKPLEIKPFKFESGRWEEKSEEEYYDDLKSLRVEQGSANYKDLDLSKEDELAKLSDITKTKFHHELSLYLPEEGYRLNKISDGNNEIWKREPNNGEYGLYCLFGKRDDNFKFVVLVLRKNQDYETKYFLVESKNIKCVSFDDFKKKLTIVVARAKLCGYRNGNGNGNGSNGK